MELVSASLLDSPGCRGPISHQHRGLRPFLTEASPWECPGTPVGWGTAAWLRPALRGRFPPRHDSPLSNDCDLPVQWTSGHRSARSGVAHVWTCNERHLDGGRPSPDRSEIGREVGAGGIARRQSQHSTVRDGRRSRPSTTGHVVSTSQHEGRTNCHAHRGHALRWLPPHVDRSTRTLRTGRSRRHPGSRCRGGHCHR